uniref:Uncharacterized protein n=1 Tax=Myotis myotis TaxID=51298 RepID=A0A7J7UD20_MYOMY|nr:hypothetical protein mMyoMyo1_008782 [Myotis myotis]
MCLFSKTYNLGETLDLSSVPHLSLQNHLHLANIVGHFHIAFNFYYFFKPIIISNLLLAFQEDRYFLGNLLFCCHFLNSLALQRKCEILRFLLIWQLEHCESFKSFIGHHIALTISYCFLYFSSCFPNLSTWYGYI